MNEASHCPQLYAKPEEAMVASTDNHFFISLGNVFLQFTNCVFYVFLIY